MSKKKKLATLVVTGMLAIALLAGGLTFALFTDSVSNDGNTFAAGTLELDSHRHDVPIDGPMFYTHDSDAAGWMGTGEWAPRDSHTRALFIKNTGTLEGKLTRLSAAVDGAAETMADINFAEQALVTIATFEAPPGTDFAASVMKEVNEAKDAAYRAGMSFWLTQGVTRTIAQLDAAVREAFLENLENISGLPLISSVEVYTGSLEELLSGYNPTEEITVGPNQTLYMGYSVTLLSDVDFPELDNNIIQGKNVQFSFTSSFEQTANN